MPIKKITTNKKAADGNDDKPTEPIRRFRVRPGRGLTYRKPYKKTGEKVEAPPGTSISTKQIPLAQCLNQVGRGILEEING